jgi:hypothetical protein
MGKESRSLSFADGLDETDLTGGMVIRSKDLACHRLCAG